MNTNPFELFVAQYAPALSLRWIKTGEGLRMEWTSDSASIDDNILPFVTTPTTYNQPAAA